MQTNWKIVKAGNVTKRNRGRLVETRWALHRKEEKGMKEDEKG